MFKNVYAIFDTRAQDVIGGLHLFNHDAVAIRFFGDIAADSATMIHRHINDHELLRIGSLNTSTGELVLEPRAIVVTGAAWLASTTASKEATT